jgi:hypothetical protein
MNQSEHKMILGEDILEKIGAYAAGELSREEAREVDRLLREDPEALRLAGFYLRRVAMLGGDRGEPPGVTEAEDVHASRRVNGGHPEDQKEYLPSANEGWFFGKR